MYSISCLLTSGFVANEVQDRRTAAISSFDLAL